MHQNVKCLENNFIRSVGGHQLLELHESDHSLEDNSPVTGLETILVGNQKVSNYVLPYPAHPSGVVSDAADKISMGRSGQFPNGLGSLIK